MKKAAAAEVASSPKAESPRIDNLEPGMIIPVPDKINLVRMAPGDVVRIFVKLGDGRELGRIVRAGHDGALSITAAPDPPAPAAGE